MKILKSLPLSIILFSLSFAQFYDVDIETTGQSQLIIFQDAITGLEAGDEIGIFDSNGIIDSSGNTGELLVGPAPEEGQSTALLWTGEQLEGVAISSVDTANRQKLEGYLAHKWDLVYLLPANHPYKKCRPRITAYNCC